MLPLEITAISEVPAPISINTIGINLMLAGSTASAAAIGSRVKYDISSPIFLVTENRLSKTFLGRNVTISSAFSP